MPPVFYPLKVNTVTSSSNAVLKQVRALHQRQARDKSGLFLIEGPRAVSEAFLKKLQVQDLIFSQSYWDEHHEEWEREPVKTATVVDDRMFKDLGTTTTPAGIMAVATIPRFSLDDCFKSAKSLVDSFQSPQAPLVVIAHGVQDPGNLGTIFRTALGAWCSGVILTKGTVDAFSPKVVRSAMGALFAMPVVTDLSLNDAVEVCAARGLNVIGCEPTAEQNYFDIDLKLPTAFILANEGQGFTDAELLLLGTTVAIPMNPETESLNVAVSAAIVLFEAVKQRFSSGVLD